MYFRQDRKWKAETQTESTTFSQPLPASGILDSILLTVRIKNNNAHYNVLKQNIWDHITKLVVKADGVESFKDIWGQTCIAEYGVEYGRLPPGLPDTMSSGNQTLMFPVLFGRRFKDGEFGLDLSKYGETRLEITNDFAVGDIYATKNIWYDIDLWFLEDAPAPPNFIGSSQISTHTWTGNSQEHTFKVPKKYKVRRIFLGCESYRTAVTGGQTNEAWKTLRYLKYTYKSGGKILRDDDLFRSDEDLLFGFPDYVESVFNAEPRTGHTQDIGLCRPVVFKATPGYTADPGSDIPLVVCMFNNRYLTWRRCTAGYQARCYAAGYGIMDHMCLHEDKPDKLEGYLDPAALADVEVKVGNSTSGGTSGIIRFITQHVRKNAS